MVKRLILLSILLSGCSAIGRFTLDSPTAPLWAHPAENTAEAPGLAARMRFLGTGERVASARNPLGLIDRVVNPYGTDVLLFTLDLEATGPVHLQPERAILRVGERSLKALRLADFKRRWPAYAVQDAGMAHDQDVAFSYVLRTLLAGHDLEPGDRVEGRLAFPAADLGPGPARLQLPYRHRGEDRLLEIAVELKEQRQ